MTFAEALAIFQGLFYALTGLWALLSIRTFIRVTGPKNDIWLVKTVGVLVLVVGVVLILAGWRQAVTFEIILLAAGCAAALIVIDVNYVTKGVIAPIYLLDAAVETLLLIAWATVFFPP